MYIDSTSKENYTTAYGTIPGATFFLDVSGAGQAASRAYIQRKIDYWAARGVKGLYLDDPFPSQDPASQAIYTMHINWVLDRMDIAGLGAILNTPGHAIAFDRASSYVWNGSYYTWGAPLPSSNAGNTGWVKRVAARGSFCQLEGLHFHYNVGLGGFGAINDGLNVNWNGNPVFSVSYVGGRYGTELYWMQQAQPIIDKPTQAGGFVIEYMPFSLYTSAQMKVTWDVNRALGLVPASDPGNSTGLWFPTP